jgi:hypothetical protein
VSLGRCTRYGRALNKRSTPSPVAVGVRGSAGIYSRE